MYSDRIVVLTSEYLKEFVSESLNKIAPDCIFEILVYHSFEDLPKLFAGREKHADGFLISGVGAKAALLKLLGRRPNKPIHPFQIDGIGLYRTLLDVLVGENSPSPSRVYLDFMLPVAEDASVQYFLKSAQLSAIGHKIDSWLSTVEEKAFLRVEQEMLDKILALRKSGKLDLIICQYSSIIPRLKEAEIPVIYPFPDLDQMRGMLGELLLEIKLQNAQASRPAAIAIAAQEGISERELESALVELIRDLALDAVFQSGNGCSFLIGTRKLIDFLTDEWHNGPLSRLLEDKLNCTPAIGYGLGNGLADAKSHALHALREAKFKKAEFIVDEKYNLIGPLGRSDFYKVKNYTHEGVYKIAEACKLSSLTIQKLLSILAIKKQSLLTAGELAEKMDVSLRNANRIMRQLQEGGFAKKVHTRSLNSKGRPVSVYELAFPL